MSATVRPVASSSFYGTTVRQGAVGDAFLVEKRHRRRESLPWHGHRHAYVAFVLEGGYRERTAAETRSCEAGCAVVHPPGEEHADDFADGAAHLLSLECGFADQSHLTRCFRQRLGTTPGALRRRGGAAD